MYVHPPLFPFYQLPHYPFGTILEINLAKTAIKLTANFSPSSSTTISDMLDQLQPRRRKFESRGYYVMDFMPFFKALLNPYVTFNLMFICFENERYSSILIKLHLFTKRFAFIVTKSKNS